MDSLTDIGIERLGAVRVVLSHTSHPGNIGAAARAMKTMGLSDLALVQPRFFPDPQAVAMASGASDILDNALVCERLEDALADTVLVAGCTARRRDLSHDGLDAREAAHVLVRHAQAGRVALLFGTEMSGLSNEELERCQMLVHIPANPEYSSLNLAAAVQVLAYELRMAAALPVPVTQVPPLARQADLELFYEHLEATLVEIGFLNPQVPKRLMTRLRRLFSRTRIEHEEWNILMGILRHMRSPRETMRVGLVQEEKSE